MDKKWALFVISLGLLIISSSPLVDVQIYSIIIGIIIVILGSITYLRNRRN